MGGRLRRAAACSRLAAVLSTSSAVVAMLISPATGLAAPEDFGSYAVHMTAVSIQVPVDPSGPEGILPSVTADVYVPTTGGGFPLVEISHAWPGTLREFPLSGWAERLASRGMVVIVSDRRAASSLTPVSQLDQPADLLDLTTGVNSEDMLRVVRWAIAQSSAARSFLEGKIDPRRLALAGHSLGGYYASFAAVEAESQGPALSALLLLDPSDERLGDNTLQSSLTVAPNIDIPTLVLASEENQHPVQCNMDDGTDCTLVAPQEYQALSGTPQRFGLKVIGSVHEDIEDPSTQTAPGTAAHLQMFERYGMAWFEYWLNGDCTAASYLNGSAALADQSAGRITLFPGGLTQPACGPARDSRTRGTARRALRRRSRSARRRRAPRWRGPRQRRSNLG